MAVTSTSLIWRGRGGNKAKDNRKSYTLVWLVRTDSTYDDAGIVMAACPVKIGDTYSNFAGYTDNKSYCQDIVPEQEAVDPLTWHLRAEFRPQDKTRTKISLRYEKKKVALVGVRKKEEYPQQPSAHPSAEEGKNKLYIYSSLIANSFGDAFDPAPEYEVSYPVVTFRRREEKADFALYAHFKDAVNNAGWWGFNARCAKVMSIEAEHEYIVEAGVEKKIWWVTYQIGFDKDTWDIKKLDAGYHYYTQTGHAEGAGKKKSFLDEDGNPRIGLLSNEAAEVGTQKGIALVDLTKPEYISFEVYPARSFPLLNLPLDPNILEPL